VANKNNFLRVAPKGATLARTGDKETTMWLLASYEEQDQAA